MFPEKGNVNCEFRKHCLSKQNTVLALFYNLSFLKYQKLSGSSYRRKS